MCNKNIQELWCLYSPKAQKPNDWTIFNIEHLLAQENTFQMTPFTTAFCFPHGIAQEASNGPSAHLFAAVSLQKKTVATAHNDSQPVHGKWDGCTLSTG